MTAFRIPTFDEQVDARGTPAARADLVVYSTAEVDALLAAKAGASGLDAALATLAGFGDVVAHDAAEFDAAGAAAAVAADLATHVTQADALLAGKADTAALTSYAPLDSPAFVNNPTAPTRAPGDNSTALATTAFVAAAVAAVPVTSPGGSSGQIQYRDAGGNFAGFGSWDATAKALTLTTTAAASTLYGSSQSAGNLALASTSDTTKGLIYLGSGGSYYDEAGGSAKLVRNSSATGLILEQNGFASTSGALDITQAGTVVARWRWDGRLNAQNGQRQFPAYSFFADTGSGIYYLSPAQVVLAASQYPRLAAGVDFVDLYGASSTRERQIARLAMTFTDPTDATRRGRLACSAYDAAGTREAWRVESDGSQALVGFFGATAVAKAAAPGTATGTDAAVINNIVTLLRNLGLCS